MAQQNIEVANAQHLFVLPMLEIPLKQMTESQLRHFLPKMLMYSMGTAELDWKYGTKPPWWPSEVKWANIWTDEESDSSIQTTSYRTDALQKLVISCYKYHEREDLLSITDVVKVHKSNSQKKNRNPLNTLDRTTEFDTICRLCLTNATSSVDIFSFYKDEEIASIVSQHFWFQIFKGDGQSNRLCTNCWVTIEDFHKLFKEVQQIHSSLPDAFAKVQQIKEEVQESISDTGSDAGLEEQSNITDFYKGTIVEPLTPKDGKFETGADLDSDIETSAEAAISAVIPEKSKCKYEASYRNFCKWMKIAKIKTVTDKVMLAYFWKKSKISKSSTMWTEYSMLKCMIYLNQNVDISKFTNLLVFLKRKSVGHVSKKSETFTKTDFEKFIREADNKDFLMMKVALIIGIAGACRRDELLKLSTEDVVDAGDLVRINIKNTKTNNFRQLVITADFLKNPNLLFILRKYMSLRRVTTPHDRFFVGYREGKCNSQPVGINSLGGIPKIIATYLGLQNSESYTGNCFRRTSTTWL